MGRQGGMVTPSCALSQALSRGHWDLWSVILAARGQVLISCFSLSLAVGFLSEEGASVRSALLNQGHEGSTLRDAVDFGMGRGPGAGPLGGILGEVVIHW